MNNLFTNRQQLGAFSCPGNPQSYFQFNYAQQHESQPGEFMNVQHQTSYLT